MILRPAAEIYRDCQNDRKLYVCHNYPACNTYVAAHPGTNQPMGVPANGDLGTCASRRTGSLTASGRPGS